MPVIPANIRGQGIAWDPSRPGVLYGIIWATSAEQAQGQTHQVFQSNLRPRRGDHRREDRFQP